MRNFNHFLAGVLIALASTGLPILLALVAVTQSVVAKAQYDLYHADVTETEPRLSDVICMLAGGLLALAARAML